MSNDLVRVRLDRIDTNLSRSQAEKVGAKILDEPAFENGQPRRATRHGRALKPKTSVAKKAAEKKQGAVTESAPTTKE
jgi:hypothetical protein